jgi:hypothetical protein
MRLSGRMRFGNAGPDARAGLNDRMMCSRCEDQRGNLIFERRWGRAGARMSSNAGVSRADRDAGTLMRYAVLWHDDLSVQREDVWVGRGDLTKVACWLERWPYRVVQAKFSKNNSMLL